MSREDSYAAELDVIYLASCAVNGQIPDAERVRQMDLTALYKAASRHSLAAITAYALESAGIHDTAFTQAKSKAIRKNVIMNTDRAAILQKLEEAGIWYMPLKGAVLQEMYPAIGLRQMADNDILFDASRAEDVRAAMEELGFRTEHYGSVNHDCYYKEPVSNFEMHRWLYGEAHEKSLREYYGNIKDRLLKDEWNDYGYHFSDEDFYVYMISHEYKHYFLSGTGLRSLLDAYVFCKLKGNTLDWEYITGENRTLGIEAFEKQNRNLAMRLFGGERLSEQESEMLDYIRSSGTFGTTHNRVRNRIEKLGGGFGGKVRYVFGRVFLPMRTVRGSFPLFAKIPILLPFLPAYRLLRGLKVNNYEKRLRAEWKALAESEE